ncbi:MAG: hypothetical protein ACFB4J_14075 [Elainellaceae cyanobacterium]
MKFFYQFKRTQLWRVCGLLSVMTFAGAGVYALTRPCVTGPCPIVQQQPDAQAKALLPTAKVGDVIQAYDRLLEGIVDLSRIPSWSSHHTVAQSHLETYTAQADALAKLVSALRQGQAAALSSQGAPHSLATWQEIVQGWQAAIADLEEVPDESAGALLAQRKLEEYRANRDAVAQRIALEEAAQTKIAEARQAAAIAEARVAHAKSPEDWQHVGVTWQVALERLAEVSPHTMAYAEAQQLEALYRPHHQLAAQHQRQEQRSIDHYGQAQARAQQAQEFEQQGQWSLAVAQWTEALQLVQQVPAQTTYHDRAMPLTQAYLKSLERSRQGLQISTEVQAARSTLDEACQGSALCQYEVASHAVQVRVADGYGQTVEQAIRERGSEGVAAIADSSAGQLVESMAAFGSSIQVPIEFYDGSERLMGTYQPEVASYSVPSPSKSALAWTNP